jgi:hypothetical protein
MKRMILFTAFALSVTGAFAQGTVTFANVVSLNPPPYIVWGPGGGGTAGDRIAASGGIRVGLYYQDALVSPALLIGVSSGGVTNAAFNGRFNGPAVTVPGLVAGQAGTFVIKAWSGGFANYEAAFSGGALYGAVSAPFQNPSGGVIDPVTGSPSLPADLTGFTTPLQVGVLIPEPSTYALAALGLGALLAFRRRK